MIPFHAEFAICFVPKFWVRKACPAYWNYAVRAPQVSWYKDRKWFGDRKRPSRRNTSGNHDSTHQPDVFWLNDHNVLAGELHVRTTGRTTATDRAIQDVKTVSDMKDLQNAAALCCRRSRTRLLGLRFASSANLDVPMILANAVPILSVDSATLRNAATEDDLPPRLSKITPLLSSFQDT